MFDGTTIFHKVNYIFPLLVFISLALALAIRRKYIKLILCTLVYWIGLLFYYLVSTTASITLPEIFLGYAPLFWIIGRTVVIGLYLAMIFLYMIFGKSTLFRISYGIMLALVISEYLYGFGVLIAWDSTCADMLELLPDLDISFGCFNVAAPVISCIALALALGIRKIYVWLSLIAMVCWAWISFYYLIYPFIYFHSPGFIFHPYAWSIIRTIALASHLITIVLYIILNKKTLFWVSYGIVMFLLMEQFYSFFWGEYYGP